MKKVKPRATGCSKGGLVTCLTEISRLDKINKQKEVAPAHNCTRLGVVGGFEIQMFIKPQKMIEEIKVEDNNVCPPEVKPVLAVVR